MLHLLSVCWLILSTLHRHDSQYGYLHLFTIQACKTTITQEIPLSRKEETYMSTGTVIVILIAIVLFIKPLQMIIQYTERMVIINVSEDFVEFDRRANSVAEQVKELGPIRVEDLPALFRDNKIPHVTKTKALPS